MNTRLETLGRKLDQIGYTLVKAIDPVDGGEIVVLDWDQVDGLVSDYEERLNAALLS